MRRITVACLCFLLASILLKAGWAADPAAIAAAEMKAVGKTQAEPSTKDLMKAEALRKAKQELNSHEWTVYLVPANVAAGKKATVETDALTFSGDTKVVSKNLLAQGYAESNCTLSAQDDGTVVWETMQVNEETGLAFFRGELKDSAMKGVLSFQPKKGEKKTLYFSTVMPEIKVQEPESKPKKKGKK